MILFMIICNLWYFMIIMNYSFKIIKFLFIIILFLNNKNRISISFLINLFIQLIVNKMSFRNFMSYFVYSFIFAIRKISCLFSIVIIWFHFSDFINIFIIIINYSFKIIKFLFIIILFLNNKDKISILLLINSFI